ncbi:glycosyl hydrolase [Paracrocinitomix mangrovi]|uniref:VPS10 domain-containing protein n=1 Tax=Paracrocinitomix mangrovi TaxID=2862509 RepID=UPI001C8DD31D|nr:glycosyl hydrolase [Paracrocinitomix mangrovi]UKN01631.1 glycosyl hydrolase [Paracrocinitomix mangrovi]
MKHLFFTSLMLLATFSFSQKSKEDENKSKINSGAVSGLSLRNIGPALTSGRIADIAVNPNNHDEYYLAVASGGVWKTQNHGTTYQPIFDGEGSYSIGCVTIDPNNDQTVWVGTGENNNQRSVAYGDGVYKSVDGGKSWKNMGLKNSEHISKIIVHPYNSDVVYVAAYGPLWSEGGERGIYKTTDGGENWERIHFISENTGSCDLVMDPENPDVLYEAVHQRRRHVFTYIGGGEESSLYKTTDGGKTWNEVVNGLPKGKMGRIGLAISPADHEYVYAIIEAEEDKGGFFRSTNSGLNWSKMSGYNTSGNYYQEIVCDPYNKDKVFSMNTWLHHTEDGGKTFKGTGEEGKHVDNHCMWIDPNNTNHWIVGCDGGVYETWDHASTWHYKENLPITQFYKVALDNDLPFYNVYGGTQDNNSQGGPSRTINNAGILNSDWFITNGGDGFESQVDPKDPNIVYAQAQYGWLVRYDKKSGEKMGIQPMPGKGEEAYRWNWDAPLLVSNHDNKRLYFSANKVFRSDDRGNTWKTISPDLTRQLDRNKMKVMGEIQSPDVVMKSKSTTIFGNIVAFDESPKNENLLYVGTDDGLIQVTTDGGATWNKKDNFPGIPSMTYVNMLVTSQHDENTVYAAFNNHKRGDFKPYILKSTDKGNSWKSISGDLPERGSVYAIAEDHVNPNLLFAGTEFGLYFSINGGQNWVELSSGLPTIAVRDIAIQRRENDLVLASFGRGFYVLDDYSPLREITESMMDQDAKIFPIKTALQYIETNPLGNRGTGSQGAQYYAAENPEFGAVFTYYVKEKPKSPKSIRQEKEKEAKEADNDIDYPTYEQFKAEDSYEDPYLLFVVKDANGKEVRKIKSGYQTGVNRITWNLRYPTTSPVQLKTNPPGRYSNADEGPFVLPGKYTVELYESVNGQFAKLTEPTTFEVKALENSALARQTDKNIAFKMEVAELRRQMRGSNELVDEFAKRLKFIKAAIQQYPGADLSWMDEVKKLEQLQDDIQIAMWGDYHKSRREEEAIPGAAERIETVVYQCWFSTSDPTSTQKEQYEVGKEEYESIKADIEKYKTGILSLEEKLNSKGIPYTPARNNFKEE